MARLFSRSMSELRTAYKYGYQTLRVGNTSYVHLRGGIECIETLFHCATMTSKYIFFNLQGCIPWQCKQIDSGNLDAPFQLRFPFPTFRRFLEELHVDWRNRTPLDTLFCYQSEDIKINTVS